MKLKRKLWLGYITPAAVITTLALAPLAPGHSHPHTRPVAAEQPLAHQLAPVHHAITETTRAHLIAWETRLVRERKARQRRAREAAQRARARQAAPAKPATTTPAQTGPGYAGGVFGCAGLEQLWRSAGGSAATEVTAASIAMAESGGNPGAVSPTDDWGLWQIHGGGQAMLNPYANAQTAVVMSGDGTNWSPWATFTNGSYLGRC